MNSDIKKALNILKNGCNNPVIRKDLVAFLSDQFLGFENTLDMAADHVAELKISNEKLNKNEYICNKCWLGKNHTHNVEHSC
mgnify:CR=1 FL=1